MLIAASRVCGSNGCGNVHVRASLHTPAEFCVFVCLAVVCVIVCMAVVCMAVVCMAVVCMPVIRMIRYRTIIAGCCQS